MVRPQSASQAVRLGVDETRRPRRCGSTGARHAVFQDVSQDEWTFYSQRLKEVAARQATLEREYQQRSVVNRRDIRKMHDENIHLRAIRAGTTDVTAAELEQLELHKFVERRRLNRLTYQLEKLDKCIKGAEESRRFDGVSRSALLPEAVSGNRSVVLRIQKLEKQLDKLMSEQQCINKIGDLYAQVLVEMKAEESGHESRVTVMENEIETRHKQYEKLVVMYHNAVTDHQVAQTALEDFKNKFQRMRKLKDKALGERRQRVEQALKETQELELWEVKLQQEIEAEHERIEDAETERQMLLNRQKRSMNVMERLSSVQPDPSLQKSEPNGLLHTISWSPEDEERIRAYEESVRKMMRVTESSTVDELVTKFEVEHTARLHLHDQVRDEKDKLEQLSGEVQHLKELEAKEKLCGVGQPLMTSYLRDELAACIEEAATKRDEAMQGNKELQNLFAEFLRGLDVLAAAIVMYRPEVHVPPTTAENHQTNLRLIGKKILSLADEAVGRGNEMLNMDPTLVMVPTGNTRIALPPSRTASPVLDDGSNIVASGGVSELGVSSYGIVPSTKPLDVLSSYCSSASSDEEAARKSDRGVALNDNEEPLTRAQIKRLSAVVMRREARLRQHEKRSQGGE
ncbi:hypothetical protein TraAM80_05859 [Trypanosoma rangeli]|uniref:Uncharacterized protein n=1 Tax=Trypanosoma rangeli TaxID=5698 RepID=A0A422NCY5_TRYRA|nr:uncharacterized protein TraAM80_05859 [Trypanosoma rangeli]RNF03296.1 hypothetical protein TraAM80_05859 [Trypanosoma rangeli]|eukprot:RNF03296.1 hypothetical protein TraAM80_05859 [Trypanosoma rangeli]